MKNKTLLTTGLGGFALSMICCFTPLLVVVFAATGVTAWLAWADFVIWPTAAVFAGVALFAWTRRSKGLDHER